MDADKKYLCIMALKGREDCQTLDSRSSCVYRIRGVSKRNYCFANWDEMPDGDAIQVFT